MSRGRLSVWASPRLRDLVGPRVRLPFPLEEPGCRLYEWGRYGLWHGLQALGLRPGDEVLTPAYHHGSEVAAIEDLGLVCRFYDATEDLEPDPGELESALGPRTRALYLIHNLGFGLDSGRWRDWCDERGLLLIEDVAMALLAERGGRPLGSWGDLSFFSLWKTHGVPDGGALICRRQPPPSPPPRRRAAYGRLVRGLVGGAAQRSRILSGALARRDGPAWDPAAEFTIDDPDRGIAALSLRMLRRAPTEGIAARRRESHRHLVARLGSRVEPPFAETREGSAPFGVPIRTVDKPALLRHLEERGIAAIDFWSVPHPSLPRTGYPVAARRRGSTVLLPVHQGLSRPDLERIADAVLEFFAKGDQAVEKAPSFDLLDQDGRAVSLADFAGRDVVLYFYPEADTPGCTAQACGIRDHQADFSSRGVVTIGVSPDEPEELKAFAERHALPFTLLSDPSGAVARKFGAFKRRRRPPFSGETLRTTILIGPEGEIRKVFPGVDPTTHAAMLLEAIDGD